MHFLVLTEDQSASVAGPGDDIHVAIAPRDLGDGRLILPLDVLAADYGDDKNALLASFPIEDIDLSTLGG